MFYSLFLGVKSWVIRESPLEPSQIDLEIISYISIIMTHVAFYIEFEYYLEWPIWLIVLTYNLISLKYIPWSLIESSILDIIIYGIGSAIPCFMSILRAWETMTKNKFWYLVAQGCLDEAYVLKLFFAGYSSLFCFLNHALLLLVDHLRGFYVMVGLILSSWFSLLELDGSCWFSVPFSVSSEMLKWTCLGGFITFLECKN